jgi:hypothetical protein
MSKRILTGALVGLAASLGLSTAVRAAVVNFNDITTEMVFSDSWDHSGLSFSGYQFWLLPPDFLMDNPSTFPTHVDSTVMATWIEPMVMTMTGGQTFDFNSVATGLGWYNLHPLDDPQFPNWTDTETVTGHRAGCVGPFAECNVATSFQVGYQMQNHVLEGFTGLDAVTFGTMTPQVTTDLDGNPFPYTGFIGFDDLNVTAPGFVGDPVPEPASWGLMIAGFAGAGALLRRSRRQAALTT